MLAERGRVRLEPEPRARVAAALESAPLQEAALNHEVAIQSREVAIPHNDPADRFITATALVYDPALVTADEAPDRGEALSDPRQPLSRPQTRYPSRSWR